MSESENQSAVEPSEFGAGIVVCLVKFTEHLADRHARRVETAIWWDHQDDDSRARQFAEAKRYPIGDAARRLLDVRSMTSNVIDTPASALSHEIETWMNSASDHFYDLDRDKAPLALIELAGLTLTIGHGFTGRMWTEDTVTEIRRLWKESCLAVDAMLSDKTDWGQW